ncbi:MAG: SDR family NAD(P)-dependent oxidoreductase [Terracidiphilus sp.]|jgi:O-antigen biosynthesis protein WbqV
MDWSGLLARPPLPPPSPEILSAFADTPLLITGAGGSIGSALALRLAQSDSFRLVLLDASENHLHQLQKSLAEAEANTGAAFVLGDAGDAAMLEELFAAHRPRIVFHAAAHKHVPLLELQPFAAIANNVFVTEIVAAAAAKYGASVLLLSTDKAVQPASVMGATKRIAEEIMLGSGGSVLRLGNVLASSGGVTEIFARQVTRGGPLTVTDPAARRYLLTMEEAVNLLLRAAHIAANTGSGAALVPALAADHRIVDLADFMARALAPGRELPVHFTGLRPGDKLAERLWDDGERARPAKDGLLLIHSVRPEPGGFAGGLATLQASVRERDLAAALLQLRALVPGFCPSETVLALAQTSAQRVHA